GADEGALDDAVVVTRPARGGAVSERLGDAAVVILERGGADRVGDAVAVRADRFVVLDLLVEEVERGLGRVAGGDVAQRLSAAMGAQTAFEGGVVRTKRADGGSSCPRRRAADL